jgi:hypothetical protein
MKECRKLLAEIQLKIEEVCKPKAPAALRSSFAPSTSATSTPKTGTPKEGTPKEGTVKKS